MSLKDVLTNSLLMFVVATCVVLIVKALPQTPPPKPLRASAATAAAQLAPKNNPTPTLADRDGVKVYYLHGNTRCPTCRTIEADAEQAILDAFTDDLKSGKIQWQVINYESPGNEHYATDYEVVAPNVVLAMFKDGKQVKWKGLPEVWEHVGDKAKYFAFVQNSLREFLGRPQVARQGVGPGRATRGPAAGRSLRAATSSRGSHAASSDNALHAAIFDSTAGGECDTLTWRVNTTISSTPGVND